MGKRARTPHQLQQHLREHRGFIRRSSKSFDDGFADEAKRLATSIRVLVHDTSSSRSLLGQLRLKDTIRFKDTAGPFNIDNLLPSSNLTMMRMSDAGIEYLPHLDAGPPACYQHPDLFFEEWWKRIVLKDGAGEEWSRRDLVLKAANQDGGAHVDHSLDERYASLREDNSMGWIYSNGASDSPPLNDPVLSSVRQIAWELEQSLDRDFGPT